MNSEFYIVGEFNIGSDSWVSVKLYETGGVLTMPVNEWKRVYGNRHPEKWRK